MPRSSSRWFQAPATSAPAPAPVPAPAPARTFRARRTRLSVHPVTAPDALDAFLPWSAAEWSGDDQEDAPMPELEEAPEDEPPVPVARYWELQTPVAAPATAPRTKQISLRGPAMPTDSATPAGAAGAVPTRKPSGRGRRVQFSATVVAAPEDPDAVSDAVATEKETETANRAPHDADNYTASAPPPVSLPAPAIPPQQMLALRRQYRQFLQAQAEFRRPRGMRFVR